MAPKPDSQALPNKEAALFRTLIKQYESKAYKKGIKTADTILRKCPDNGETLAMKGLLLNCLERKEEAYDHVKRGVKANLRSHVCWHVYGLLYRSDREYDEASKCYKAALRWDPDNLTVLRDLTQLQIQQRDLPGFLESRQRLLDLKPQQRQSWVGLALAHHLAGNHEVAATVIESMETTSAAGEGGEGGESEGERYERSELMLYRAQILEEGGRHTEALNALETAEKDGLVRDRIGATEARGRLFLALGRAAEAEAVYRRLLAINTENHGYHDGLIASLRAQGGASESADVAAVFAALQAEHPHSVAARRRPLDFLAGGTPAFEAAADAFVRRYLAKGIPSLFSELKPLYADPAKLESLGKVMARFEDTLTAGNGFPEPLAPPPAHMQLSPAEHHSLTWCQLYMALHADKSGDVATALAKIDTAIAADPETLELHSARSKILKHAGDLQGAAFEAENARKLALSDRYANCQAAKALFRAGRAAQAEATVALFTRDGDQANNLYDMQATWYEIGSGRAYLAAGDRGRALKRFLKVDTHFSDFVEDQFDFHGYCLRKQTMRAYVDMLRMEDMLYRHPVYAKAVAGAVQAYVALADDAAAAAAGVRAGEGGDGKGMTPEEVKKAAAKRRKEEARRKKDAEAAAAEAAVAAAATAKKGGAGLGEARKPDLDPDGVQLAATEDPLGEAGKLVRRLEAAAADRLDTQLLAFDLYLRKGKLLLALGAVKRAVALGGEDHPRAHVAVVRLATAVAAAPAPAGAAGEVLREQTAVLLEGKKDAAGYAADWAARHSGVSLLHRLAAAQAAAAVAPERTAAVAADLAAAGPGKGATHKQAVQVHKWLSGPAAAAAPTAATDFAAAAAKVFRWSRHFGGDLCVELKEEDAEGKANGDAAAAAAAGVAALKL